jgi:hypothetical protein
MDGFKAEVISETGYDAVEFKHEDTGRIVEEIWPDPFEAEFQKWIGAESAAANKALLSEQNVCFKQEIASITHPLQFKTEFEMCWTNIPFNGRIGTKCRPRLYQRSVTYRISANVCYPLDLVITHVEKCAKQGALAAAAIALTGNIAATKAAFTAALMTCMAAADFPNADKISVSVSGDTFHGDWHPV